MALVKRIVDCLFMAVVLLAFVVALHGPNVEGVRPGRKPKGNYTHRIPSRPPLQPESLPVNADEVVYPDMTGMHTNGGPVSSSSGERMGDAMDLDNLNMAEMSMLNNISSIDEMIGMLHVRVMRELPLEVDARDMGRAECKPELKVVYIAHSLGKGVMFYPDCVRLPRCGGCCNGRHLQCMPVARQYINIKVLKINSHGWRGKRQLTGETLYVPEEKHTKCNCSCMITERDCNSKQVYKKQSCSCRCKDRAMESWCKSLPVTHYWMDSTCECKCNRPRRCSTGLKFSLNDCRCHRKRGSLDNVDEVFDYSGNNI